LLIETNVGYGRKDGVTFPEGAGNIPGMLVEGELNGIQALIAERGAVRFRDFMEMALYHPEHGYYGAGRAMLGRKGDYYTNVSVGSVFGEMVGVQFLEMWEVLGRPDDFAIVEQGANDGAFAADVLGWCREVAPDFFKAVRYVIVERIERLQEQQRERLADFHGKVEWYDRLRELPRFTGVHFSNELVDAFPVHLVRYRDRGWRELWVTADLNWMEMPVREEALRTRLTAAPRVEGYTTEVNLEAPLWADLLAAKIERGWVMTVDYGYPMDRFYAPERQRGTLECYAGHMKGLDPLDRPGYSDLTAHVEFTSLAKAFMAAGMELAGYTDQYHFLTGLAAVAFAKRPPTAREARGIKTLLHPEMLGMAFRVLGMSRGVPEGGLVGFQYARDARVGLGIGDGEERVHRPAT
jgi:SAM-dependent MidA family methyltransferase